MSVHDVRDICNACRSVDDHAVGNRGRRQRGLRQNRAGRGDRPQVGCPGVGHVDVAGVRVDIDVDRVQVVGTHDRLECSALAYVRLPQRAAVILVEEVGVRDVEEAADTVEGELGRRCRLVDQNARHGVGGVGVDDSDVAGLVVREVRAVCCGIDDDIVDLRTRAVGVLLAQRDRLFDLPGLRVDNRDRAAVGGGHVCASEARVDGKCRRVTDDAVDGADGLAGVRVDDGQRAGRSAVLRDVSAVGCRVDDDVAGLGCGIASDNTVCRILG